MSKTGIVANFFLRGLLLKLGIRNRNGYQVPDHEFRLSRKKLSFIRALRGWFRLVCRDRRPRGIL